MTYPVCYLWCSAIVIAALPSDAALWNCSCRKLSISQFVHFFKSGSIYEYSYLPNSVPSYCESNSKKGPTFLLCYTGFTT